MILLQKDEVLARSLFLFYLHFCSQLLMHFLLIFSLTQKIYLFCFSCVLQSKSGFCSTHLLLQIHCLLLFSLTFCFSCFVQSESRLCTTYSYLNCTKYTTCFYFLWHIFLPLLLRLCFLEQIWPWLFVHTACVPNYRDIQNQKCKYNTIEIENMSVYLGQEIIHNLA